MPVLRELELLGVRLNLERLAEITARVREEIDGLEREIFALAGEEFTIGSPQQLGEILFERLGLSRKRRGKTGYSTDARVLQAIRAEHEIVPEDRALARALDADQDLPRRAARAGRRAVADPHDLPAGGRADGPPLEHQPEHAERPDPHPAGARDPRLLRGRAGRGADLRRLLPDRASRARPGGRRGGADGDLRARRGRAHGDRFARLRRLRRGDRPGDALEGEDDQLRHRLRALRLRPRRPAQHPARGGEGVHRRLPRAASRRSRPSWRRRSSRPRRRAT